MNINFKSNAIMFNATYIIFEEKWLQGYHNENNIFIFTHLSHCLHHYLVKTLFICKTSGVILKNECEIIITYSSRVFLI